MVVTEDKDVIEIEVNNCSLVCTPDHKIITDTLVEAQTLPYKALGKATVYDAIDVAAENLYETNGIVSHNCIILDETAFIDNWDEFSASVLPTISSGATTKIVQISTPNGLNHFYKTYSLAKQKLNDFVLTEVSWERVPGRNEAWRQKALAELNFDELRFSQEYAINFIGSSGTLIRGDVLKSLVFKTPIVESNDGLKQYQAPGNGKYVILVDTSEGKGMDFSVAQVIDVTTMPYNQAAVFRSNMITPIDYASIVNHLSVMYNGASILVENNAMGQQVADLLHYDFENENVISTASAGPGGKRVSGGFGSGVERGVRMTKSVKATGCSVLKLLIEQQQLIINDFQTIEELSRFSRKGTSFQAESGWHDDTVMSLVLFAWLSNQKYFSEMNDINTMAKLREKTEAQVMDDLLPFGFVDSGPSDYFDHDTDNRLLSVDQLMFRSDGL